MNNTTSDREVTITVPFGHLKNVMDWCRFNCSGNWFVSDHSCNTNDEESVYVFCFDNEYDQMMFQLTWI